MLTDIEKTGINIIVLIRVGLMRGFFCDICKESGKDVERNCAGKEQDETVFYHELAGEFTACPLLFVPNKLLDDLDHYDYIRKFPAKAPNYEDVNPRFWEMIKYYDSFESKAIAFSREEAPKANNNEANDLKRLKDRFMKKADK